jgi:signal transduction histidine kinase
MKASGSPAPTSPLGLTDQQFARLVEVSVTLNSSLDPDQVLKFILETAAELLDCEAASIMLYDETRGELLFISAAGSDPVQLAQIPVPLEGSIAGTVFRENRPLVINNVSQDPRHYALVGERLQFEIRSLLGVPMCIRDRTTGVLEAINKRQGVFSEEDVKLLLVIASQAAVAIHNARLVQALQRAYDELRRIDKIKSDFLAIASHELRTPLGVILGYASFLKEEAQGELSEHASAVMSSAMRLRTLVESMTNVSLLQLGSVEINLRPVAIQEVVEEAVDDLRATAEAKNQSINIRMPEESILVSADPDKLGQIFTNLLNNSIRFTPVGGEIVVEARTTPDSICVSVKDTGIGIPANELDHIFEEFYQVDDHMTRRFGGMGLGLAIAHGLVRLHGGRIWAESEGHDKGATFNVELSRLKVEG